jgi:hypothetical protein
MAPGTALDIHPTEAVDELSASAGPSKKRPHIINLSDDDEDDDEIRQSTMIIDDIPGSKKAKVAVVIKAN